MDAESLHYLHPFVNLVYCSLTNIIYASWNLHKLYSNCCHNTSTNERMFIKINATNSFLII